MQNAGLAATKDTNGHEGEGEGRGRVAMDTMKRVVRVGRPQDQDRWRRDDYAALSPDRRLRLMLELREAAWPDAGPLRRSARVRRLGL